MPGCQGPPARLARCSTRRPEVGTAKSHAGPTSPEWRKAKSRATRWAKAGGGAAGMGVGGVVAAAASALASGGDGMIGTSGAEAAQRLGGLLTGFETAGVEPTLRGLGLDHLVGLSGVELLMGLVEYVSPESSGLEQSAASAATDATITRMYELAPDGDIVGDEALVATLMETYFAEYIAGLILRALDKTLIDAAPGEDAARLEREVHDHVAALLEHHLDGRPVLSVDWMGEEGRALGDTITREVLEVLQGDESG